MKSLTNRDFFKLRACDALSATGCPPALSKAERYAQVVRAKSCRNLWFTSTLLSDVTAAQAIDTQGAVSVTPRFSQPIILTDMLSLFAYEPFLDRELMCSLTEYGGEAKAYGVNFFNINGAAMARLLFKYERNYNNTFGLSSGVDLLSKYVDFVPRLLRPYQTITVLYQETPDTTMIAQTFPHLGFRAIRPLLPTDPYFQLNPLAEKQTRAYINENEPETFFMEVRTPLASLGAISTGNVTLKTPLQARPLLILGAASNVEGCQARLMDEGELEFTYQETPKVATKTYVNPPLNLWAPNSRFRNANMFCMWAMPHVLDPGASLKIVLANGCLPSSTGVLQQPAATRSDQDVRITFLCRTV